MAVGFHVYIDESGDEGFKFDEPGKGSSRWFVLSAVVTRVASDLATVKLVDEVRERLGKQPRVPLHFRNLKHEHRLPYVDLIARSRLRTISVLVYKPSLREPEKFRAQAHLLYRYATRYLLERVSWLCRDHRLNGNDFAKVFFSNRSCMSYDELRNYLIRLRQRTNEFGVQIDWSSVTPDQIEARTHDSLMGLQIADAVASSYYMACELSPQGFNESRYATMLQPVLYRHDGVATGYGLKLWPREVSECVEAHFAWLKDVDKKKDRPQDSGSHP
ncbi:MAG: DUF3800 domain-containing protein [Phycisphaeraceae bacterium]